MTAVENLVKSRLKFKITSKGIRDESDVRPCQNVTKFIVTNGRNERQVSGVKNKLSVVDISVKPCMPVDYNKRRPETSLDGQREKRQKMDYSLKQQCCNILKTLMIHRVGCYFSEPVDPVKLKIPDYFSIISKPMDLGTIKLKLECESNYGAEDFAADVRLTFSNAMLYNPPGNLFHQFAKLLNEIFNKRWKVMKAKLKSESRKVEYGDVFFDIERNDQDSRQTSKKNGLDAHIISLNKVSSLVNVVAKRAMSLEEKQKLRLEFLELSSGKMTEKLRAVFQKFGLTLNEERIDSFFDAAEDETLWKLKRAVQCFWYTRAEKVKPAKMENSGCLLSNQAAHEAKCSACWTLSCHCRQDKIASALSTSNEIALERSLELDRCSDKPDCEVKNPMESHSSKLDPDFDGSMPHLSTPVTTVVSGWTSFNVQMSPKKALRAAMLKSRFADTIFRATHQIQLDHGEKSDPVRMQQEKERMERQQLEEKIRIEAEIKAVEEASRMRREREREAARMALQKMEKTVEINENQEVLNYLEMLRRDSPSDYLDGEGSDGSLGISRHSGNFLERLGLYIKDDCLEEDEILSGEEGEILS